MKTRELIGFSLICFCIVFSLTVFPVSAETSVSVSENGSGSNNQVGVTQTNSSGINQSNSGIISNIIHIFTNTGNNSSSNNTGSNSNTSTGNATSEVNIQNNLNSNYAQAENCCTAVPEFGMIPGALALVSSAGTYFYLKKRNFSLK